jgi:hypothetical protein
MMAQMEFVSAATLGRCTDQEQLTKVQAVIHRFNAPTL